MPPLFPYILPNITVAIAMPQPPRYSWNENGMVAECAIRVNDSDEMLLYEELTGQAQVDGDIRLPVRLDQLLGAANRDIPFNIPPMYVTEVRSRPFRSDEATAVVLATVRLETFPYKLEGDWALIREEMELSGEFVQLPNEDALWWKVDDVGPPVVGTKVEAGVGVGYLINMQDWIVTHHRITPTALNDLLQAGMRTWINSINTVEHYSPKFSTNVQLGADAGYQYVFPKYTLLMKGIRITRDTDSLGSNLYRISLLLRYRDTEWNRWFRPGFTLPQEVFTADADKFEPYPPKSWTLAVPEPPVPAPPIP